MTLRISASPLVIGDTLTNAEIVSAIADLDQYVDASVALHPTSLLLNTALPADCTVTEARFRKTVNPEKSHVFYKGPAITLTKLFEMLGPDAARNDALTPLVFGSEHGAELVLIVSNGATPYNGKVIWSIKNAMGGTAEAQLPSNLVDMATRAVQQGRLTPNVQNYREALARIGGGQ